MPCHGAFASRAMFTEGESAVHCASCLCDASKCGTGADTSGPLRLIYSSLHGCSGASHTMQKDRQCRLAVRHDVPLLWISQGLEITPARMLSTDSGMCSSPFDVCSVTIIRRPRLCTSSTMLGLSHRAAGGSASEAGDVEDS